MLALDPNQILSAPFWPEKVRVISVQPLSDGQLRLEVVGCDTKSIQMKKMERRKNEENRNDG